jgi:hypothetical protein
MPFVRIAPALGRGGAVDHVAVSCLDGKGSPLLAFYFGPTVLADAGVDSAVDRLDMLEGVDQDANSILFERAPKGYRFYSSPEARTKCLRVSVSKLKFYFPYEPPCPYTVLDYSVDKHSGILVQCPPWLRYKQTLVVARNLVGSIRST